VIARAPRYIGCMRLERTLAIKVTARPAGVRIRSKIRAGSNDGNGKDHWA
jgi:hypothetical protein